MGTRITTIRETLIIPEGSYERFLPLQAPCARSLREHHVVLAGISDLTAGYEVARIAADFHLILYTLKGRAALSAERYEGPLERGSVLVAPAGTSYRYHVSRRRWRILWFHLRNLAPWGVLGKEGLCARRSYQTEAITMAAEGFLAESRKSETGAGRLAEMFGGQVALYLAREVAQADSRRDRSMRQRLDALWDNVDARLEEGWTVARLACEAGMSAATLHRAALHYAGRTPMQMVTHLRMLRAEQLLSRIDHPLCWVAAQVGYATPFAFSNAFKRWRGASPSVFRAALGTADKERDLGEATLRVRDTEPD